MYVFYVVLIILGIICVVLSFMLGEKFDKEISGNELDISEDVLKVFFEKNREGLEQSLYNQANLTKEAIMEEVTKELNRLSNEKIMAVDEFSDTVLEKINQNHSEVIFLYNMLNEKEKELKELVSSVNGAVKKKNVPMEQKQEKSPKAKEPRGKEKKPISKKQAAVVNDSKELDKIALELTNMDKKKEAHTREEILTLYEKGKSITDIAKDLQMGKGEIKLIIDLYQGARK